MGGVKLEILAFDFWPNYRYPLLLSASRDSVSPVCGIFELSTVSLDLNLVGCIWILTKKEFLESGPQLCSRTPPPSWVWRGWWGRGAARSGRSSRCGPGRTRVITVKTTCPGGHWSPPWRRPFLLACSSAQHSEGLRSRGLTLFFNGLTYITAFKKYGSSTPKFPFSCKSDSVKW